MKGLSYVALAATLVVMTIGVQRCSSGIPILDKVNIKITESSVSLTSEFDDNVVMDLGGRFMIPDLEGGYIELVPGGGGGGSRPAAITFGVDISQYGRDFDLRPVNSLPNGMPFPGTVTGPMLAWVIDDAADNTLVAYMGIETGEIAFAAQLSLFDEIIFPGSLISYLFRDEATNEIVADATIYGPQVDGDGNVVQSGGVFIHAYIDAEFLPGGASEGQTFEITTGYKEEY